MAAVPPRVAHRGRNADLRPCVGGTQGHVPLGDRALWWTWWLRWALAGTAAALWLVSTAEQVNTMGPAGALNQQARPQRIVSLVPATTEMLFEMGAGDRVVGVSSYDTFPPEATRLPTVGGLLDPNIERLISLRPDFVIVFETQTEVVRQLDRAGVPVFRYVDRGLRDITEVMRALGERVGAKAGADAAARRIDVALRAARARVAGRPTPKTLLVFTREPGTLRQVTASGGFGFLHDALELAGGSNAFGEVDRRSVIVSTEMMLARAPDVILELHYGASLKRENLEAERRVWNALPSVPAVKNNRVYLLTGDEFVVPGPRIALAVERLARTLHPEVYDR